VSSPVCIDWHGVDARLLVGSPKILPVLGGKLLPAGPELQINVFCRKNAVLWVMCSRSLLRFLVLNAPVSQRSFRRTCAISLSARTSTIKSNR
jgi:hypothetical protein